MSANYQHWEENNDKKEKENGKSFYEKESN